MLAWMLVVAMSAVRPGPVERTPEAVMRAATEAADAGDLARARMILETAYARDPLPAYLFARGVIEQDADDCRAAMASLRRFLATSPSAEDATAAEAIIAECQHRLGDAPASGDPTPATTSAPPPPPPVLPRAAIADAPPVRPSARRVRDDPWGASLVGGGSVLAVVGAGLLVGADARRRHAGGASNEAGFADQVRRARTLHDAGLGVVVTGAALVVAGVIRYGVLAHRRARGTARMARRLSWSSVD